jgi:hypothetical protein
MHVLRAVDVGSALSTSFCYSIQISGGTIPICMMRPLLLLLLLLQLVAVALAFTGTPLRQLCATTNSNHVLHMGVRARTLRIQQLQNKGPVLRQGPPTRAERALKRERRRALRAKLANSGKQLLLLRDDPAWYIGVIGLDGAGRAIALRSLEAALRKQTELKVGKDYVR